MSLFGKRKESVDQLEEKRDRLIIESDIASKEQEIAEREATIKELRKRYGPGWKNILGLKGRVDLSTLRSILDGMKKGLKGKGGALYNPNLSPLPRKEKPDER